MFSTLMMITFSYMLGILLSPVVSISTYLIFLFVAFSIYIPRFLLKKTTNRLAPLIFIMILLGLVRNYSSVDNVLYSSFPDKYVTITGNIDSLPSISSSTNKYRYIVNVEALNYLDTDYKIGKKILLSSKSEFDYGDKICASGFLSDFGTQNNEFEFDYRNYYQSLGITARMTAHKITKTGVKTSLSPAFYIGKFKYNLYKNAKLHLNDDDFAIVSATALSDKSAFSQEYKTLLVKTGSIRLLCSPFVHISIMFALLGIILKNRKARDLASIIVLAIYLLWDSGSPVAVKSALLLGIIIFNKQIFGYANKYDILSFIVLIMTVINPQLCFNGGFMLSVISTMVIYISYKPISEKIIATTKLSKRIVPIITIWISLSFGALPFVAYYSNGINPYGIFITPLLIPVVAVVIFLTPILFATPTAFISLGFLKPVFSFAIFLLKSTPYLIERLPFYQLLLRTPTETELIFWSILWIVFLRFLKGNVNTERTKSLLCIAAGLLICVAMDLGIGKLNICFVNVGQGDASVIHSGFFETVLIDGGGGAEFNDSYNIGENVFVPYLVSHGFYNIDVAILTHYHKDHAEGIVTAMENLKINTIVMPDTDPKNEIRLKIEELARKKDIKIEYLNIGDKIKFRSGLCFTVLAPDRETLANYYENENNTSLVLKAEYGNFNALFMGDYENEENLLTDDNFELLKVSHHGSITGNSEEFLKRISPKYAVISVGKNNSYGLPNKEVIDTLESMKTNILRTDRLGDIRLTISKKGNIKYTSLYGGN